MAMICFGENRFLLMSNFFQLLKSCHAEWNDIGESGQNETDIFSILRLRQTGADGRPAYDA
jgi:hypothetical protein